MGRGLSELQRWILRECLRDPLSNGVWTWQVCLDYFKWPPRHQTGDLHHGVCLAPIFCMRDIGAKEYRRVMATISRSYTRLHARGLVEIAPLRYAESGAIARGGVIITDAGLAWLSVNEDAFRHHRGVT